ncbi:N-acetylmannosamine-6-phosphate 2-epimerase [Paenibacillus albicereus]|uniref:Putative N-acetylmannosamine-6-phosphate 2-epimerase n=1 Tax=Paenibacillus albicereus TaxID=2726185 RepID=A0A6H2H1J0_9BACL|nr:N-acetylmannosamine-6-phosphate 2-epimerase [Paenibacillus albicereus]QJC53522.1 N-acetylmannosamine-6-phosphate 2-epimerase [Paenibacillus albicereus]
MSGAGFLIPPRSLIVSCQALEGEPLHGGDAMVKMARAAVQSGAAGIRCNGASDIRAIREAVDVPVIGLIKRTMPGSDVFITPTAEEIGRIAEAGADIVALDVTDREGRLEQAQALIALARSRGLLVMADVSTLEEGLAAARMGADLVGTTLAGYTPYSRQLPGPDLRLVEELAAEVTVPIIAEGRIWTPEEAAAALACGAHAVVVGSAITRPQRIAARFAAALASGASAQGRAAGVDSSDADTFAGSVSFVKAADENGKPEADAAQAAGAGTGLPEAMDENGKPEADAAPAAGAVQPQERGAS